MDSRNDPSAPLSRRKHRLSDVEAAADAAASGIAADDLRAGEPKRIRGGGYNPPRGAGGAPHDDMEEEPEDLYDADADFAENDIPDDVDDGAAAAAADLSDDQSSRWSRPPVPPSSRDPSLSDLNLQWLDIDMISGRPLPRNPNPKKRKMVGATSGQVPVLRVFGVNENGNSVAAYIHGFTPYCYFALPEGYDLDESDENMGSIRRVLNDRLRIMSKRGRGGGGGDSKDDAADASSYCHGVQYVSDHRSIMGYRTPHTHFLKVYVGMPTMVPTLKRAMEEGIDLPGVRKTSKGGIGSGWDDGQGGGGPSYQPFECNVPFVLRFMIDRKITGAGWLTLPKGTYALRDEGDKRQTHCQLEVDISFNEIVAHEPAGEWNKIAPLRVLSFDIECQGRKGHFPEAEMDPVIQIANVVSVYGKKEPVAQNVFTLKGCLPIVGAQVISSETEEDMLLKWRAFLQKTDADIITGYNVQNFDIPYLLDRADALGKGNRDVASKLRVFRQWGRIRGAPAKMRETMFSSAAYGRRANVETTIDGRVIFDMLPYMQRNHKLSSYTLNSVCAEFLGQQKEDVHHSIISDLQNGTDEDRHRLATYCLKDALLPQRLMDKLSVLINYVEMARVTGVPVSFLISRGQQIKVFSMILRKCQNEKLLVPTLNKGRGAAGSDVGYEGATVLDPIKSYYEDPIATLDFASLYPSIMQAYNLCYSTLVSPQDVPSLDSAEYKKSENGNVFVHSHVKKGILPTILGELLSARKRAKRDMKNAPTAFEKAVQNGRQLALKVSANSVYGFTGAGVGQLPCLPIASSVTSYGRLLLEKTKAYVEEKFTVAHGYKYDAQVIYGDTDSVMVKFGTATVEETFPLAIEAAEKCSEIFPNPILLEFEKVYYPYLLMNKKRYAGLLWTNTDKYDYMDTKGLETVRRDNCALVREVIQTSLDKILIGRNVPGAINYVKSQIADLLQNKMDISRLVITKSLNKGAEYALGLPGGKKEDYKMKQAHVELAARMRKRDAGSAPQMGDRVPYVIITGAKGAANFEKAEDPVYVLENNIPIDCKWYLTNQLSKPLTRIFEPIIDNVEKSLLQGDHTRKIFIPTPTARKGSLMMFAAKKATCLGCKASIDPKQGHLCKYCVPREGNIYLEKLAVLREAELRYARLWAEAQRVHGTVHTDIMCTGDGCACHFYRRKKVQTDIRLAQEVLDKFGQ
uniref:DNA polymerase n=1 Tax=Odontella aurita TaxID=265563 RepID=A0A7S4JRR7_9STRA|mmetsp:Transcript_52124/g.156443  ORF Transcript_52124/g.156443 Transcript_52124/m.156443 type:complete len:1196 (+) Transcript_52124:96-3683(+)